MGQVVPGMLATRPNKRTIEAGHGLSDWQCPPARRLFAALESRLTIARHDDGDRIGNRRIEVDRRNAATTARRETAENP